MLKHSAILGVTLGITVAAFATVSPASATGKWWKKNPPQPDPVACAELATDPAHGLAGNSDVKSATSAIVPAAGSTPSYCQVDILYGENPDQNINVRVGLPLNSVDGGTGGVEGAWNGRTQARGGGGCSGNLGVTSQVADGYVGSGNDTGHSGGDCTPGVNEDGTYNYQFINDFIRNGMKAQILFSKAVTKEYYGEKPKYNYWNGCSTGGRQGYVLAQELGKELDGILANAPAIYWTRFQTAQMWGQIAMKDLTGGVISPAKLSQATASAVAACDGDDGVTDGVIDDPRTCEFSATENICGAPNAPASNCLTPEEAEAVNKIWDGPRNADGDKIWFGLDRGTGLCPGFGLNCSFPFPLGVTQFQWDTHDRDFDWQTVTMFGEGGTMSYADVAQAGSRNIADVTDTFDDLDEFKKNGGKLLTLVGMNDQLIMPRGVVHYYRQMAARYGRGNDPDFRNLQKFYRLFRVPGAGHCGGPNAFNDLVNWVENGDAPKSIIGNVGGGSRPLCPYPQTAIYKGSGDTNDAANFYCGGNLETKDVVCEDALVKYKHEVNGKIDDKGFGYNCVRDHHPRHHGWGIWKKFAALLWFWAF